MQYLTYDEYTAMGGTLAESTFKLCEMQARKEYLDYVTFDRLSYFSTIPDEVKECVYLLIQRIDEQNQSRANSKQSESNDGVSVTYRNIDESAFRTECIRLVQTYLNDCRMQDGTPIIYRGIAKGDFDCKGGVI